MGEGDLVRAVLGLAYLGALLLAAEGLASRGGRSPERRQKVLFLGLALYTWVALFVFSEGLAAALPLLALALGNLATAGLGLQRSLARRGGNPYALSLFAGAMALLLVVLWEEQWRFGGAVGALSGGTAALAGGKEALRRPGRALLAGLALWAGLYFTLRWAGGFGLTEAGWMAFLGVLLTNLTCLGLAPPVAPAGAALTAAFLSVWVAWAPVPSAGLARLGIGLLAGSAIGTLAWWRGALSADGAAGAVALGSLIFTLGGLLWTWPLLAFFLTASLWTAWGRKAREELDPELIKEDRRTLAQVLANGGWGAWMAVLGYSGLLEPRLAYAAYVGAVAAAAGDTWATEVGLLSPAQPRLITTGRPVPPGTSGGVTALGLWAAAAGSGLVALVGAGAALLNAALGLESEPTWPAPSLALWAAGFGGGLFGSLADSFLGAAWQAVFFCPRCRRQVEQPRHFCGEETFHIRGIRWLRNNMVNFFATVAGSAVAALLFTLWREKG
ncbi:MAG: DUF92 domain-containing protein [Bacillota bacterium]|nr:DUF92 domain-containing protein [Bacillota bacterium]